MKCGCNIKKCSVISNIATSTHVAAAVVHKFRSTAIIII